MLASTTALLIALLAPPAASPLAPFLGSWTGTGEVNGAKVARETQRWTWALGGRFVQVEGSRAFEVPGGEAVPMAYRFYFRPDGEGPWRGFFMNDLGTLDPVRVTVEGKTLTVEQERSPPVRGVFRVNAEPALLEVSVRRDGKWARIGAYVLRRDG